ncbi:uncharacterized protein LOC110108109 [Dendrobium catenatum]|uniref:uncharacterized protein LOC110108109 n=1 Tax=Dendrobium catenatum TaxID=906689 RepID=UPI0010A09FC6|nr:uncharacterized protein LOC110108109 [Dendrobium catenatum]
MPTIRLLLTLSLHRNWLVYQLDISNAFLHGDLPKDIYMCQPPGFTDHDQPHVVCKLQKSFYEYKDCKSVPTPVTPATKQKEPNLLPHPDPTIYRRLAGSLQYLTITRPDIAFAANQVCQHMQSPTEHNFKELKRPLRYVKGTLSYGLPITVGSLDLQTYSDADWAFYTTYRKSISGFCSFLGPNLISWTVKKQVTVDKSSTEAEYRSLSAAASELLFAHLDIESTTAVEIADESAVDESAGATESPATVESVVVNLSGLSNLLLLPSAVTKKRAES